MRLRIKPFLYSVTKFYVILQPFSFLDDKFLSNTVLLWSTIIGYILSLDLMHSFVHSITHWLSRARLKLKDQEAKQKKTVENKDNLISPNKKLKYKQANLIAVQSNKSLVSNIRPSFSNGGVKQYITSLFHVIFFVLSIAVVLFIPSPQNATNTHEVAANVSNSLNLDQSLPPEKV